MMPSPLRELKSPYPDYIVQAARFEIISGFGCISATNPDGVSLLIIRSWGILLPLISVIFYCRASLRSLHQAPTHSSTLARIIVQFLRHRKAVDRFLHSNGTVSHSSYFRVLSVACFDIFLSLPFGIVFVALTVGFSTSEGTPFPFYAGWAQDHADWTIPHVPYAVVAGSGAHAAWALGIFYINEWTPVVLGFAIFGLFGLTHEACWSYAGAFWAGARALGWKHRPARGPMSGIVFGSRSEPHFEGTGQRCVVASAFALGACG
jgi:hypothetical protein